jgi:N-acetylglutamate synthase-like GNAT family acetyltransferase
MIKEITEGKGGVCADILATLPHWFGIPESNAGYIRDVEQMPMFVVEQDGQVKGFIALKRMTQHAFEIHVLGVRPELHRKGTGRALVQRAERYVREQGVRLLTVKTRGPSRPDAGYEKTRAFYEATGFLPIEEFPTLWDPENPALMLIKVLD